MNGEGAGPLWLDPRVWQALVAGLFLAVGWWFNGWQNRRMTRALRSERLRDYHRALHAEIGTALSNLWNEARVRGDAAPILARMRDEPDFVPFIPRERNDHVFDTLLPDIHILPRQTIDPIVQYYTQVKAIDAVAEDMRGHRFSRLSQQRRMAIYRDYIDMKVQALAFGQFALSMIAAFAAGGAAEADEVTRRINTRDAGPSGQ